MLLLIPTTHPRPDHSRKATTVEADKLPILCAMLTASNQSQTTTPHLPAVQTPALQRTYTRAHSLKLALLELSYSSGCRMDKSREEERDEIGNRDEKE